MAVHFKKYPNRDAPSVSLKEKKGKHKQAEKEEAERGFWSEERDRFDFDMIKDPTTGQIPRYAPQMAAEAAQRMQAEAKRSIDNRSPAPITVVPRGPNNLGGRTRAIGIDKRNANIMLAGSVSSGVFRSTNGGVSWTRVAPIGQIHNVTAIAQDPRAGQEDTWYYGGGEPIGNSASLGSSYRGLGIWKSIDNGLTWAPLANTQFTLELFDSPFDYVNRIVVDPTNGNVYAAAANTIQRSTDGGSTWSVVLGTFVNTNYTEIIVTPTGRFYAGFDGRDAAAAGVWTSTTGALGSWTKIGIPGTTPGWNAVNAYGRTVLAYAPSNPNIVFALYWNGISHTSANQVPEAELFKWDQTTTTWTDLSANLPNEPGYSQGNDPFAVQTGYDLVVVVKPDDVNTVFVAGTNVYRSTSGFTNTTATTRIGGYNSPANYALYPNHHPDVHVLNFATGDNNTLYCGDDGGIQKADITTPSVTWTSLNNDYVTYQYYHADIEPKNASTVVMGGAQDNGTTSNPTGTSFSSIFGGDGCQTGIVSYTGASNFNVIGSSQSGFLVRLIAPNSGFVIYPATSGLGIFVTYFQLDQDNTNLLFYADNAALFRTRNARNLTATTEGDPSVAWQKMTAIGLNGNIRCMASSRNNAYGDAAYTASDANRKLYIGTSTGRVYRVNDPAFVASTTAAVNITPPGATLGALCSSIAVNPFDDNEIMVTYSNYGVPSVFHTFNANSATPTWTAVEGPAAGPVALGSARSTIITKIGITTIYLVGNSTGLYSTQALSGATTVWEQVAPNEINYAICASMRLRVSDNRIVLGTHGNGMYELQLPPAIAPVVTWNVSVNNVSCNGGSDGSVTVTALGGTPPITYSISPNVGTKVGNVFSGLTPQTYTFTATDTYGFSATTQVAVTQPAPLVITPTVTNARCFGSGGGSIAVTVSGGTGNLNYSFSGAASTKNTTSPFNGIAPGVYTLSASDANGCLVTQTVTVTQPPAIVISRTVTNATCFGSSDGKIVATATGGTGAISLGIEPKVGTQSGGTFTGLSPMAYMVIATDANNCYSEVFAIVGSGNCDNTESAALGSTLTTSKSGMELTVYPNPVLRTLNIQVNTNIEGEGQIALMDIAGKQMLTNNQTFAKGLNYVSMDISLLVSGVYVVQYTDAQKNKLSLRIIKN